MLIGARYLKSPFLSLVCRGPQKHVKKDPILYLSWPKCKRGLNQTLFNDLSLSYLQMSE